MTVVLFAVRNVKTKHNRVAVVQVLLVLPNVLQNVKGIQNQLVVVLVLHVVPNVLLSVKEIQNNQVVVVQALHVQDLAWVLVKKGVVADVIMSVVTDVRNHVPKKCLHVPVALLFAVLAAFRVVLVAVIIMPILVNECGK